MTEPLALRVLREIRRRCLLINGVGRYYSDVGARVYLSRRAFEKEECPAISIAEEIEEATASSGGPAEPGRGLMRGTTISVAGFVPADDETDGVGLQLIKADIKRAVMSGDFIDEGGAKFTLAYLGATPVPRADGGSAEGVAVQFRIKQPEVWGDPDASQ